MRGAKSESASLPGINPRNGDEKAPFFERMLLNCVIRDVVGAVGKNDSSQRD
jgi:hypothetical protein